ncbi:MAG: hypothetical protein ABIC18_02950 [Candidatus Omnitrophota bacterium]
MKSLRGLLAIILVLGLLTINPGLGHTTEFYEKDTGKFAIGVKAGTLGLGIEAIARIKPRINARIGINACEFDYTGTESDIKYDFDLELFSLSALLDWHPFDTAFRISAGGLYNQNSLKMTAKTTVSYQIGNTTYTAAEVGTLTGEMDIDDIAPYVGIGWGNAVGKNKQWSFSFDLGVIYQDSPKVKLNTTGSLSNNAVFQAELDREKQTLEDKLEDYQFYPVISMGVCYSF